MDQKVNFTYKLNGNFDAGINVFELSPAILSLGKLIRDSHEITHPEKQKIAIHIKPFKEGSFPIEIVTFSQNLLQETLQIIRSQQGQDVKEVLEYLGLITAVTGFTGISLIPLVLATKGKVKKIAKLESGDFLYTPEEGETIVVKESVSKLFQDSRIQENIYRGVGKTLEFESVTTIESYLTEYKEKTIVKHSKDTAVKLQKYSELEIPSHEEEKVNQNKVTLSLHPKRGSYEGEPNSWSFRKGESEEDSISLNISDADFLNKIKTGEYRPHCDDIINAELIEKQKILGTKIFKPTYELIKVLSISKKPEQIKMDF